MTNLHFKLHRIKEYLIFWTRLPYHVLFHKFEPYGDDGYQGYNVKGFIICNCGFVEDLGVTYGMHCEKCYKQIIEEHQQKQEKIN